MNLPGLPTQEDEDEPATLDDVCGLLVEVLNELREANGKICDDCREAREADES